MTFAQKLQLTKISHSEGKIKIAILSHSKILTMYFNYFLLTEKIPVTKCWGKICQTHHWLILNSRLCRNLTERRGRWRRRWQGLKKLDSHSFRFSTHKSYGDFFSSVFNSTSFSFCLFIHSFLGINLFVLYDGASAS